MAGAGAVAGAVAATVGGGGAVGGRRGRGGGSVLEIVEEVAAAVVVVVVATGRTGLIRAPEAAVTTTGAAAVSVDNDDGAGAADSPTGSSDVDVADVDDVTEEGALNLQNPAAFALATRMFLSCFSVYGLKPRVVQARDLRGTSTTVAIILILGCDSCDRLSCIDYELLILLICFIVDVQIYNSGLISIKCCAMRCYGEILVQYQIIGY